MCGIFGTFNTEGRGTGVTESRILRDLMTAGTVRGFDGTGMFFLDAEGKEPTLWLQKEAITGGAMAETVGRGTIDSRFVVGHNRAATIGGVSTETTHPFSFEHVTGVHNGTFRAWRAMWKDSDQSENYDYAQAYFYQQR